MFVPDALCKEVQWIGRDGNRSSPHPFSKLLGSTRCAQLGAEVIDINIAHQLVAHSLLQ